MLFSNIYVFLQSEIIIPESNCCLNEQNQKKVFKNLEIKQNIHFSQQNERITGFLLGLIVALTLLFVALEYSASTSDDADIDDALLRRLVKDVDMVPAVDQTPKHAAAEQEKLDLKKLSRLNIKEIKEKKEEGVKKDEQITPQAGTDETTTTEVTAVEEETKEPEVQKIASVQTNETAAPVAVNDEHEKTPPHPATSTPTPPGGWVAFMQWLTKMLKYPPTAKASGIQGTVNITMIIDSQGKPTDLKVKQSADAQLDNEAMRVMKLMGKWKPGTNGGKPCATLVEIPIVFKL